MKTSALIVLLIAALSSGACGDSGFEMPISPENPGGGGGSPPPIEQPPANPELVSLPATYQLLDASGNPTKMWVALHRVSPDRESKINLNNSMCPSPQAGAGSCFSIKIEFGFETVDNPYVRPVFRFGFGPEKDRMTQYLMAIDTVGQGESFIYDRGLGAFRGEDFKYLVIEGSYPPGGSQYRDSGATGSANFYMGYRR